MNQLKDKVIAITGGASGIGYATAKECAARGARLALSDLNIDALNDAAKELESQFPGLEITTGKINVADSDSVDSWVKDVMSHYGHIDGACNIAGVDTKPGNSAAQKIVDMTNEHWQFLQDVNLNGTFYCVRAQMRVMGKGSSIVNAASTAGLRGAPKFSAYTASKHGVVGLTKSAAKEAGASGIRINAVCPGPIDTPLLRRMIGGESEYWKQLEAASALQGIGKVEHVARTFCYLLSDDSGWTTGTTITIDGGTGP